MASSQYKVFHISKFILNYESKSQYTICLYFINVQTTLCSSGLFTTQNKRLQRVISLQGLLLYVCIFKGISELHFDRSLTGSVSNLPSRPCLFVATAAILTDSPYTSRLPVSSAAPRTSLCDHGSTCISCAHATHH